jgi:hypothetical protein
MIAALVTLLMAAVSSCLLGFSILLQIYLVRGLDAAYSNTDKILHIAGFVTVMCAFGDYPLIFLRLTRRSLLALFCPKKAECLQVPR